MKKSSILAIILILVLSFSIQGCSANKQTLKDGYYTAEMADYSHGWKEFLTIFVHNGSIVSVEYNAKNPSGFIKAWDMAYMRKMNAIQGTYPNKYTRTYSAELLSEQSADNINIITGASHSHESFSQLAKAVIEKSKAGDKSVAIVNVS